MRDVCPWGTEFLSVFYGNVDIACSPEGMQMFDVDMFSVYEMVWGIFNPVIEIEGHGVTGVGHSEIPIALRHRWFRCQHGCVSL